MFIHTPCLIIYIFRGSIYTVHALCMVTIHIACSNCDIEMGPDSRQVPNAGSAIHTLDDLCWFSQSLVSFQSFHAHIVH